MDLTGPVHLLLGAPGHPPPSLPESSWTMWVPAVDGVVDPPAAAARARVSPVALRGERTLVATVAADDLDGLLRLGDAGGSARDAARTLTLGRLGAVDRSAAIDLAAAILADVADPGAPKALRRHWPDLHVLTPLAPSVPALVPVSRVGLGLLLADMYVGTGRPADALAVLRALPSHPAVRLALAATLLGNGEHDRVLETTTDLANVDDVSALALVARSVAARSTGDLAGALDAACAALTVGERSPGVLAVALEERSHLYSIADQDDAARADMEALAALAAGPGPVDVPEATPLQRAGGHAEPTEQSRDRARERMRRRITGVGEPGTFGGRHHSTYREEIAAMFALGQTDAVEELLLGLLDAVEDEVAELQVPFDPTFFLTLADLYNDCGRTEDLAALQDRYAAAEARAAQLAQGAPSSAPTARPGDAPVPATGAGGVVSGPAGAGWAPEVPDPPVDDEPVTTGGGTEAPRPVAAPVTAAPDEGGDDLAAAEEGTVPGDPEPVGAVAPQGRRRFVAAPDVSRPAPEDAARRPDPSPGPGGEGHQQEAATDPGDEGEDGERARRLRALERTVRGPRVRSL